MTDAHGGSRAAADRARDAGERPQRANRRRPAGNREVRERDRTDCADGKPPSARSQARVSGARRRGTLPTASSATASPLSLLTSDSRKLRGSTRNDIIRTPSGAVKGRSRLAVLPGRTRGPTPRGWRRFAASRVVTASMESMTDTLTRPVAAAARPPAREPPRCADGCQAHAPRLLVGVGVALWTALLGLAVPVCVTLSAWVTAAHHDNAVRPALAMAVQIWLVAHHSGLHLAGGSFSIVPLGLSMAFAALLMRAGRQAARLSGAHDRFDALTTGLSIALPYSVVGRAAHPGRPIRAGSARYRSRQWRGRSCSRLSLRPRRVARDRSAPRLGRCSTGRRPRWCVRAALFATATVIGVGFALVVAGLATHAERAAAFVGSLHGGIAAAALMAVASIAYLPNVVVWASCGHGWPGLRRRHQDLGRTRRRASGCGSGVAAACAAAVGRRIAGRCLAGRARPGARRRRRGALSVAREQRRRDVASRVRGLAAGGAVGLILGVLAWLSSGSLAPGRMARLGPSPWQVGLAAAVEIGLVAAATAAFVAWRRSASAIRR